MATGGDHENTAHAAHRACDHRQRTSAQSLEGARRSRAQSDGSMGWVCSPQGHRLDFKSCPHLLLCPLSPLPWLARTTERPVNCRVWNQTQPMSEGLCGRGPGTGRMPGGGLNGQLSPWPPEIDLLAYPGEQLRLQAQTSGQSHQTRGASRTWHQVAGTHSWGLCGQK